MKALSLIGLQAKAAAEVADWVAKAVREISGTTSGDTSSFRTSFQCAYMCLPLCGETRWKIALLDSGRSLSEMSRRSYWAQGQAFAGSCPERMNECTVMEQQ